MATGIIRRLKKHQKTFRNGLVEDFCYFRYHLIRIVKKNVIPFF
jgi:hypothetical protein